MDILQPDTYWPPQLAGLLMSVTGMLAGSLLHNIMRGHHAAHPKT